MKGFVVRLAEDCVLGFEWSSLSFHPAGGRFPRKIPSLHIQQDFIPAQEVGSLKAVDSKGMGAFQNSISKLYIIISALHLNFN